MVLASPDFATSVTTSGEIEHVDTDDSTIVGVAELPVVARHLMVTRVHDNIFKPNEKYALTIAASSPIPTNIVMATTNLH